MNPFHPPHGCPSALGPGPTDEKGWCQTCKRLYVPARLHHQTAAVRRTAAGSPPRRVPRIGDMTSQPPEATLKASRLPCMSQGPFQTAGRALTAHGRPFRYRPRTDRRRIAVRHTTRAALTLAATVSTVAALAAGLTGALAAPAAAATAYTITDLGSLGGGVTHGLAINASGQVTGVSVLSKQVQVPCPPQQYGGQKKCFANPDHAFLWSNGTMA